MLEEVLRYINNRFDRDSHGVPYGSVSGTFTVQDHTLVINGLLEGQYFWVEGSRLNDGLHLYKDSAMKNETFDGTVVFLVVPKAVEEMASEIADWNTTNAAVVDSPFQSESFGGYSYSKATGSSEGSQSPATAWQVHFGARLSPFRKLSRDWV